MCYYFDHIMRDVGIYSGDILLNEKSNTTYKNTIIYVISYKKCINSFYSTLYSTTIFITIIIIIIITLLLLLLLVVLLSSVISDII